MMTLLNCLIYLSYLCAFIVLVLYIIIFVYLRFVSNNLLLEIRSVAFKFFFFRYQRRSMQNNSRKSSASSPQMQLLRQSLVVFALYSVYNLYKISNNQPRLQASILSVFAMSFVGPGGFLTTFDVAYIENLLNLSIAAAYPICFLAMSGDMKRCFEFLITNKFVLQYRSETVRTQQNCGDKRSIEWNQQQNDEGRSNVTVMRKFVLQTLIKQIK